MHEEIVVTKPTENPADVTQELPTGEVNDEATTTQPLSHSLQLTTETATATEGPIMIASLQQENEFLKAKIEAYKQELTIAREAYEK